MFLKRKISSILFKKKEDGALDRMEAQVLSSKEEFAREIAKHCKSSKEFLKFIQLHNEALNRLVRQTIPSSMGE